MSDRPSHSRAQGAANPAPFIERDTGDHGGAAMRAASFCALAMAAAIWWLSHLPPDIRHQSIVMLVPAVAAAFGPFFLVSGVRSRLRLRRYGRSTIAIEPPVQGDPLRGVIRTQRPVPAIGRYTIRLRCEDIHGRTMATTLFKGSCHVGHSHVDSVAGIPFAIEPAQSDSTIATDPAGRLTADRLRWWIEVQAAAQFISYQATFDISRLLGDVPTDGSQPWWLQINQNQAASTP